MNLNALVAPITRAVTPGVTCELWLSKKATTDAAGKRTPQYDRVTGVVADVQAVSGEDLMQLDSLNIQGVERVAYLQGNVEGINRVRGKGGDLLVIASPAADAGSWLVKAVLETWGTGGWCKVALALQVSAP